MIVPWNHSFQYSYHIWFYQPSSAYQSDIKEKLVEIKANNNSAKCFVIIAYCCNLTWYTPQLEHYCEYWPTVKCVTNLQKIISISNQTVFKKICNIFMYSKIKLYVQPCVKHCMIHIMWHFNTYIVTTITKFQCFPCFNVLIAN